MRHRNYIMMDKLVSGHLFQTFMLQVQKHFSLLLSSYDIVCETQLIHAFLIRMYVDLVYQLESLVYDIRRLCAHDFPFFDFF